MKPTDRIVTIREELAEIEAFLNQGQQPADKQVEWLVKMLTRLELRFSEVLGRSSRPSYRITCENARSFVREIKMELEGWRTYGIEPESIAWERKSKQ